jgi:hypothetical protein
MVRDLIPLGRVFRPGREIMVRDDHLTEWIEAHPVVARDTPAAAKNIDDPIDFAEFKRTALKGKR